MARRDTDATRSFMGLLFKRLAREVGAKVLLEPTWKTVGQIEFKDGRKRYFRYSSVDLNTLGASEISKDKDYAAFFMRKMGYSVVPGKAFYSDRWAKAIGSKENAGAAIRHARGRYPLFVKPNDGSQGYSVSKVHNEKQLRTALTEIFKKTNVALVQKPISGHDYRIVVLDDEIISAYERIPLSVIGDGRSTIKKLLERKQKEFVATGRDTKIKFHDPRIKAKLRTQGRTLRSIPEAGEHVILLDNANLSTGGDAVDVTYTMHVDFKTLAIRLTRDMGLRMCGVDVMVPSDISSPLKKYTILETNAAPGLDHYVKSGPAQKKIVEDLYRKVLRALSH
jgi:D-alanine-D-alanine ligase-like ATP-grasp enzyme